MLYFGLAIGADRQNSGSAATHSFDGILQFGRTAKTRVSEPAAFSSASARVCAALMENRVPSGASNTVPPNFGFSLPIVITRNLPCPGPHAGPSLKSSRYLAGLSQGSPINAALRFVI